MLGRRSRFGYPEFVTSRLRLCLLAPNQADLMVAFRRSNRDYLKPWEPLRTEAFYTSAYWEQQLSDARGEYHDGVSLRLSVLPRDEDRVIGVCSFTNIVRGTFQSCHLGYALGEKWQGQGIMHEALQPAIDHVFNRMQLHRIMANYMPHNAKSGNLLNRLGFRIEGRAAAFLKIDGQWQDHILTSLINPAHL